LSLRLSLHLRIGYNHSVSCAPRPGSKSALTIVTRLSRLLLPRLLRHHHILLLVLLLLLHLSCLSLCLCLRLRLDLSLGGLLRLHCR
jgi:hypothetical protein